MDPLRTVKKWMEWEPCLLRPAGKPRVRWIDQVKEGFKKMKVRNWREKCKLLADLKDRRGYSHFKEEALDRTMWRNRFVRGFGPVVRQNTER
jgi:hypothetical protein